MIPSSLDRKNAKMNKASSCAYLFPKSKLLLPNITAKTDQGLPRNFAILNSLGGSINAA